MNQFCLVGRIAELPVLKQNPLGWNTCLLTLRVQRSFPESDGSFRDDYVEIEVNRGSAETLAACADLNGWISVKGRIERMDQPVLSSQADLREDEEKMGKPARRISLDPKRKTKRELSQERIDDELRRLKAEKSVMQKPVGGYKFIAESLEYIQT